MTSSCILSKASVTAVHIWIHGEVSSDPINTASQGSQLVVDGILIQGLPLAYLKKRRTDCPVNEDNIYDNATSQQTCTYVPAEVVPGDALLPGQLLLHHRVAIPAWSHPGTHKDLQLT